MISKMAKLTAKNQLTLPRAVVAALGWPTHFRVQVHDGALILWPGRLMSEVELAAQRARARETGGGGKGGTGGGGKQG